VIVLTTSPGREHIRRDLLNARVWQRLRQTLEAPSSCLRFSDTGDSIRIFPAGDAGRELDDIITAADNAAAGDFILDALRQFSENPDTRVILSIAGGRKTMAALGALAMTLLGRPGDRLCHVLVNPPFDDPRLVPRFCFPDPAVGSYTLPGGSAVPAASARITLCDVPFVRVRVLFAEHLRTVPGTFSLLVERANRSLTAATTPPRIVLEPGPKRCQIGDRALELATPEFILLWLLCERARQAQDLIQGQTELSRLLSDFDARIDSAAMPEKLHWDSKSLEDDEYVRKLASRLRTKLRHEFGSDPSWPLLDPAPERGHYGLRVAPDAIEIGERA
jgi:CRISPR-associated protein (TIGR02584 family)